MILHLTWHKDCHSQQQKMQCFSGERDEVFSVFKTTLKDVEEFTSPEMKAEGGKKQQLLHCFHVLLLKQMK